MTCWSKSGNFWTMVTGWPDVRLTPYMGAVVLYVDLEKKNGVVHRNRWTTGTFGNIRLKGQLVFGAYLQRRGGAPPTTHPAVSSLLERLSSPPSRASPYAWSSLCWVTLGGRVDGRLEKRDLPLLPSFARPSLAARAATSWWGYI